MGRHSEMGVTHPDPHLKIVRLSWVAIPSCFSGSAALAGCMQKDGKSKLQQNRKMMLPQLGHLALHLAHTQQTHNSIERGRDRYGGVIITY